MCRLELTALVLDREDPQRRQRPIAQIGHVGMVHQTRLHDAALDE